ncbi:MAG: hypothetical protein CSA33_08035 [Desulfobulbus propionicus]|nr:MAG: hypothetical protein CSA33_08035 [Desulfobulbus propionicus]
MGHNQPVGGNGQVEGKPETFVSHFWKELRTGKQYPYHGGNILKHLIMMYLTKVHDLVPDHFWPVDYKQMPNINKNIAGDTTMEHEERQPGCTNLAVLF